MQKLSILFISSLSVITIHASDTAKSTSSVSDIVRIYASCMSAFEGIKHVSVDVPSSFSVEEKAHALMQQAYQEYPYFKKGDLEDLYCKIDTQGVYTISNSTNAGAVRTAKHHTKISYTLDDVPEEIFDFVSQSRPTWNNLIEIHMKNKKNHD